MKKSIIFMLNERQAPKGQKKFVIHLSVLRGKQNWQKMHIIKEESILYQCSASIKHQWVKKPPGAA